MADILKPRDGKDVEEAVRWALAQGKTLEIVGRGTKRALGRPSQSDMTLDLSELSGVTLYEPAELVGLQVIAVVNLPPRRVAGLESEVLILAVQNGKGENVLLIPERPVPDGGRVS